jgi:putative transposase
MIRARPQRLDQIAIDQPLFFVTFCTRDRKSLASLHRAHDVLQKYGHRASTEFNVALGRYLILPDHIHLFVRGGSDFVFSS